MIRCNNCMATFEDENELILVVEQSEFYDGNWHTTDRFLYDTEMDLRNTETERYEIFKGCSFCLADEYLMDLSLYEDK